MDLVSFVQPVMPKAEASDTFIIGIILICYRTASILFHPGLNFSYMSTHFASSFDNAFDPLSMPLHISTIVGDSLVGDWVYRSCLVTFAGCETWINLIV